jgi:hypothetical protein
MQRRAYGPWAKRMQEKIRKVLRIRSLSYAYYLRWYLGLISIQQKGFTDSYREVEKWRLKA